MATSNKKEIERAILDAINEDKRSREGLMEIPEKVADLVRAFMPVRTGESRDEVSVTTRKTELKKLSKRKVKLGTVYSDDPDPAKVATIEYGRSADDKHGRTPAFHPFQRAAEAFNNMEL